jgi:hypothetical protein
MRGAEFDFIVEDSRMPAAGQQASQSDLWVAGGWFDRQWQTNDALFVPGSADARTKSLSLVVPSPTPTVDPKVLATYVGSYQIPQGPLLTMTLENDRLVVRAPAQMTLELQPLSDSEFLVLEALARLTFNGDGTKEASSLTVLQDGREFSAKRVP